MGHGLRHAGLKTPGSCWSASAVSARAVLTGIAPDIEIIGEAVSGLRHLTGDPDRPPSRINTSLTDEVTGLYAAFGAMMAVVARQSSGRGQCVDATLY